MPYPTYVEFSPTKDTLVNLDAVNIREAVYYLLSSKWVQVLLMFRVVPTVSGDPGSFKLTVPVAGPLSATDGQVPIVDSVAGLTVTRDSATQMLVSISGMDGALADQDYIVSFRYPILS